MIIRNNHEHISMTLSKEYKNERQREYRKRIGNKPTIKYEKTKKGFLVRLYRNMKSRVEGVQKVKFYLYEGKEILDKNDFYEWALSSKEFHDLFQDWEESDYERRITPSVDRINSDIGYIIGNMEWVPFHENCRRGTNSRFGK